MATSGTNKSRPKSNSYPYRVPFWILLCVLLLTLVIAKAYQVLQRPDTSVSHASLAQDMPTQISWDKPQLKNIPNEPMKDFITYGHQLVTKTYKYIGPNVPDPSKRFAGNNLACQNCHFAGGTTKFAAPYIGVTARFPQFRGRSNTIGTIEDRINGCMVRSMNGRKLPIDSKEMKSIVAYMSWLSRGVTEGVTIKGRGYPKIKVPDRRANIAKGKIIFTDHCASCHQMDGSGLRAGQPGDTLGYTYPPLWGDDSFNNGAGMHRVLTAARFIKANMPYGTTYKNPVLSDEEAYDVAAYINSKSRPQKAHLEKDYPDLWKKPADAPYPPFIDRFSQKQHQFGPFQPIIKAHKIHAEKSKKIN